MDHNFSTYRAVYEQGFLPIFTKNSLDSRMLVEACVEAGMMAIEYTLRRPDVIEMIPWIRREFPHLKLIIGSVLDDDQIVKQLRRKNPQLRTISELVDMGVDGLVSVFGWDYDNIHKYSQTHLVIPRGDSPSHAYRQMAAGAHFIKYIDPDLSTLEGFLQQASFGACPLVCTLNMDLERIHQAIDGGVVLAGGGFSTILDGALADHTQQQIVAKLHEHVIAVQQARCNKYPQLRSLSEADDSEWLKALPHYCPFAN